MEHNEHFRMGMGTENVGPLLRTLVQMIRPQRILEVGAGYTTPFLLDGLKANEEICNGYIEGSLAMCTSLVPVIGYDQAAAVAYKAYENGKTVREVVLEDNLLSKEEVNRLLDYESMIKPKK